MPHVSKTTLSPALTVRASPGRGRGVHALRAFAAGECIERAPVIVLAARELDAIRSTLLGRYYFEWGEDDESGALALGYGSLYNHSYTPNATYEFREELMAIDFLALREIGPGEEITINYNNLGEFADAPMPFEAHANDVEA